MSHSVELIGLTKRFGSVTALRDVNLRVAPGEFVTLLGPSGCGKTTLLRVIAGFEMPTSGRVLLDNIDVTDLPPYRRDVNQVFQSYALFPHLSVYDNVAFGLRMKRLPGREIRRRVAEALDMVELVGLEHRRPAQLSGGQQQRVALARALVCQPKVLLLDEPMAALDAQLRRAMQIELKRLQHRLGITFVFVTHDQSEALLLSDRIAVMNAGLIEQFGAAADIYHRPRTAFVARFLGQANVFESVVVGRNNGHVEVLIANATALRIPVASVFGDDSPLLADSRSRKLAVAVRAEQVRLLPAPPQPDDCNVLPGQIVEILFGGAMSQVLVRTAGGLLLTACAPRIELRRGDPVWCHIAPDSLIVLNGTAAPESAGEGNSLQPATLG
ncbi:ABC transporter ATP-binding protein [Fontivita pretiosa]|uniref:ABC transporter ATP-binding protein n=1 Tax=Fontivita pretiosa TaxID=2989684 RepID=UPI003D1675BC